MKKLTNPYGNLHWCIGSEGDFWCFDYHRHRNGTVTLHAVINSETGHFIQDAEPPIRLPNQEAIEYAKKLTEDALDWCAENDVKHDKDGWNQSPCYFWRSLHCDISKTGHAIRIPVEMVRRPIITSNYL